MSYRVAVASSNGDLINQHFGRCIQFIIYEIQDNQFEQIEVRKNVPACRGAEHEQNLLEAAADLIADCNAVLVSRIGLEAINILKARGIQSYTVVDYVEAALQKLTQYISQNTQDKLNI